MIVAACNIPKREIEYGCDPNLSAGNEEGDWSTDG